MHVRADGREHRHVFPLVQLALGIARHLDDPESAAGTKAECLYDKRVFRVWLNAERLRLQHLVVLAAGVVYPLAAHCLRFLVGGLAHRAPASAGNVEIGIREEVDAIAHARPLDAPRLAALAREDHFGPVVAYGEVVGVGRVARHFAGLFQRREELPLVHVQVLAEDADSRLEALRRRRDSEDGYGDRYVRRPATLALHDLGGRAEVACHVLVLGEIRPAKLVHDHVEDGAALRLHHELEVVRVAHGVLAVAALELGVEEARERGVEVLVVEEDLRLRLVNGDIHRLDRDEADAGVRRLPSRLDALSFRVERRGGSVADVGNCGIKRHACDRGDERQCVLCFHDKNSTTYTASQQDSLKAR